MKPYLSIIIPYHNSETTIGRLVASIFSSVGAPTVEVLIVDDGSKHELKITGSELFAFKRKPVRIIRQKHNKGPAAARNRGAKLARGKFLVFLDSDVELFPDTLHNLARVYLKDPDVVALTGVWVKEQRTDDFFPNFKALRDWSYWINERDKSGYYFLFSTRIASIKKTVFLRLGGFDEKYPGALVEDIELTYRIARRYAIIFAQDVRVRHEFEEFWPIAKKYFLRAYYWTKLYAERKKFDPVATTLQEAITAISGVGVVGLFVVAILTGAVGYWAMLATGPNGLRSIFTFIQTVNAVILVSWVCILIIHIVLVRKFLAFMVGEKGIWFALRGFLTGLLLYSFISAGALWGKLKK
jgi:glycosyltransferase involved in cell wall biosynthesis